MIREVTLGVLGLAVFGSAADGAFAEKFSFEGGIAMTKGNVTTAQLDGDPALEILVSSGCRILIIDGSTGEIEFERLTSCGIYPGDLRVVVRDIDDDGLFEVIFTVESGSNEVPNQTVVVDTDAPVSTVQPWESDLGELRTAPEPMESALELTIDLAEAGATSIRILDVSGRLIKEVADQRELPIGHSTFQWDGKDRHGQDVASGVYFVQVTSSSQTENRRITIIK